MMKKISAAFCIFTGISIIGLWAMLYFSGQVIELSSKPIDILFHITNEGITAVFLIVGGCGLLRKKSWAGKVHFISMGMLFYSLLAANGYYTQKGILPMTIMFSTFTIITIVITISSFLSKDSTQNSI